MSLGFVVLERAARPHDNRSLLVLEQAHLPAIGTGLFGAQLTGLPLRGHLQGPCQQGAHGGHGDIFHFRQVNIQSRPLLAPLLPDDDFPPAFRQFLDVLEILRLQFARSHVASLQRDTSISPNKILP